MRNLIIFMLVVSSYQLSTAQSSNYYQEGYNQGCELATAYSQGQTSAYRIYQNTINAGNLPQEYKNGVNEGWIACKDSQGDLGCPDPGCNGQKPIKTKKSR